MNPLTGWKIIDRRDLRESVSYAISHEREIRQGLEYQKRLEKAREEVYEKYRNRYGNARFLHRVVLPQIKKNAAEKYNVSIEDLPRL